MKSITAVSFAAIVAMMVGTGAQAAPFGNYFGVEPSDAVAPIATVIGEHPYHHCHGRVSGTADVACGSLTGGPSGGLF